MHYRSAEDFIAATIEERIGDSTEYFSWSIASVPYEDRDKAVIVNRHRQIVFTIREAPLLLAGLAWLDMLANAVFKAFRTEDAKRRSCAAQMERHGFIALHTVAQFIS